VSATEESATSELASDELLLNQWRERLLIALVSTALVVLMPAWSLQLWQSRHGVSGAELGLWWNLAGMAALLALRLWRGHYASTAATANNATNHSPATPCSQ
jgi:F0F1-type ATP synthase assembly protein I